MSLNWVPILIAVVIGVFLGFGAAFILRVIQKKTAKELADNLFRESEVQRQADINAVLENLKWNFRCLSLDALSMASQSLVQLAEARLGLNGEKNTTELEAKKGLIDQRWTNLSTEFEKLSNLMKDLEKDRVGKFGKLTAQLKVATEQASLAETTTILEEALGSAKILGQWGDRMAEDVLRVAGFIENVNYLKQNSIEGVSPRPDFTLILPRNLKVNMDVKFPLDNYVRYHQTDLESDKTKFRNDFLGDVRAKTKEVISREYINEETVGYVLLFIPNEQIYTFIQEYDAPLLDEAIKNKVLCCYPMTLYSILAVIRQAVDNVAVEATSNEILSLFGNFKKQWQEFSSRLEQLGKLITDAQREYDSLTTTTPSGKKSTMET